MAAMVALGQRRGEQSEGKGTDKPYGPELHNGLLWCPDPIPHSLSFLEGFSYTKNNGYLGVIVHLSGVFNPRTQLIDALIESWTAYLITLVA